jgi:hypothetical protein
MCCNRCHKKEEEEETVCSNPHGKAVKEATASREQEQIMTLHIFEDQMTHSPNGRWSHGMVFYITSRSQQIPTQYDKVSLTYDMFFIPYRSL